MKPDTATGLVFLTALILLANFREPAPSAKKETSSPDVTLEEDAVHLSVARQEDKKSPLFYHASFGNAGAELLYEDNRRGN